MNNAKNQAKATTKATTNKRMYKKRLTKAEKHENALIEQQKEYERYLIRAEEERKAREERNEQIKKYYEDNKELIEKQKKQKEINEKNKRITKKYKHIDDCLKNHKYVIELNLMNYEEREEEEDKLMLELETIECKISIHERMGNYAYFTLNEAYKRRKFLKWKSTVLEPLLMVIR